MTLLVSDVLFCFKFKKSRAPNGFFSHLLLRDSDKGGMGSERCLCVRECQRGIARV